MPPADEPILAPRTARRRLLLALAAAALLAATAVLLLAAPRHRGGGAAARPSAPAATLAASPAASPGAEATEGTPNIGPITLLSGKSLVQGVYLGYPHTTAGAVSAADQFATDFLSTLDPDRGAAIARLIADNSYPDAPAQFAASVQASRQHLGLPATGAVPPGYAMTAVPVMYQLRDVRPDSITVLFLLDLSTATPTAGSQTQLAVVPFAVHFDGADWKMLTPVDGDPYLALSASPDTADATAKGWADLREAGA